MTGPEWAEPGAYPVAAGVHRIPLPLPDTELTAVNVYAVVSSAALTLVDSGWAGRRGETALAAGLAELGHRLSDVTRIVVTHAHPDHYTQALVLRDRYGTEVCLGRGERASVEANLARDGELPHVATLRRHGAARIADAWAAEIRAYAAADRTVWGLPDAWLDDGQRVDAGGRGLDVYATPGHTSGHVVARDAAAGLLFAGDHVLPHITPSLGYESRPEKAPLRSYLDSLRLVRDLPDTLLLPAHGPVTPSVHTRVDELLAHHEQRLAAALAAVRAGRGPRTRWRRRCRGPGGGAR